MGFGWKSARNVVSPTLQPHNSVLRSFEGSVSNLLCLCDRFTDRVQTCHELLFRNHQRWGKLHDIVLITTLSDDEPTPAQTLDDPGHARAVGSSVLMDKLDAVPQSDPTNFRNTRNVVQASAKPLEAGACKPGGPLGKALLTHHANRSNRRCKIEVVRKEG